jgi:Pyruvate/2-oxoacid:ferredoxin oxidoreductase delta subunit
MAEFPSLTLSNESAVSGLTLRKGELDVLVVAGPRLQEGWPSPGVKMLVKSCAEFGLQAGWIGGAEIAARGVLPMSGTGGIVIAEDTQKRIHRIQARAVVKFSAEELMPDPFPGWVSTGLLPLQTARKLQREALLSWSPCTVLLGSGNAALGFGILLLEAGVPEVICVETYAAWGDRRIAGWEVNRRRFESLGGKIVEGRPLSLKPLSAMLWELRLQDSHGVRILEVARVVSAGPFRPQPQYRQHPPGSLLFEVAATAAETPREDIWGWTIEEDRARWVACKIVRALRSDLNPEQRQKLESWTRSSRWKIRRHDRQFSESLHLGYRGKWLDGVSAAKLRNTAGVPREFPEGKPRAVIECAEKISCSLCVPACPEKAIEITKESGLSLKVESCTGCGICLDVCPSSVPVLLEKQKDGKLPRLTFSVRGSQRAEDGDFVSLVNRRGEGMGSGRAVERTNGRLTVEVAEHLAWDARGIRRKKALEGAEFRLSGEISGSERASIVLDGVKRLVRAPIPLSVALLEIGQGRPAEGLDCRDGSCGLCEVDVDGIKQLACRVTTRSGMRVDVRGEEGQLGGASRAERPAPEYLCPCQRVSEAQVRDRIRNSRLQSLDSLIAVTQVTQGRCQGQICMAPLKRVAESEGMDCQFWIDWRFPWSDWTVQ